MKDGSSTMAPIEQRASLQRFINPVRVCSPLKLLGLVHNAFPFPSRLSPECGFLSPEMSFDEKMHVQEHQFNLSKLCPTADVAELARGSKRPSLDLDLSLSRSLARSLCVWLVMRGASTA